MDIPFRWPSTYQSLYATPEPAPEKALWFVFRNNNLLVTQGEHGTAALPPVPHPEAIGLKVLREHYLGMLGNVHCYSAEVEEQEEDPPGWGWLGLRELYGAFDDDLLSIAGRASQLLEWERTHSFCGVCGSPTVAHLKERARQCSNCGLITYPKVTPAIMALVRRGDQILLARSPRFRRGMVSVLAGFVEPGETLEQCVTREVMEEVGLTVKNVRYVASQSWPFPHQMMIAFIADYESGEINIDPVEISEANWYDIDKLPSIPGKMSLARRLIDAAVGGM